MRFAVKNTWPWDFSIRKIAISWVLLNRIRRKMSRSTDTNQKNVWDFFQNFPSPPLSKNVVLSWKRLIRAMVIWPDFSTHGIGRWLVHQVLFSRISGIFSAFFVRTFFRKKIGSNFSTFTYEIQEKNFYLLNMNRKIWRKNATHSSDLGNFHLEKW